jgi:dephospho-CoA kinase
VKPGASERRPGASERRPGASERPADRLAPGRRFLLVGLTGGIATGKSTVSSTFRALGAEIIDADLLAREVVDVGEPAYRDIVEEFGAGVLQEDGGLDRKKLGAIVFADAARRKRLEEITHPAIRERFLRRLAELIARDFAGIVFFDAPVMIESGNYLNMEKLVVVVTDDTTQRVRLLGRDGIAADEIERKIASQMPVAEKAKLADYVIDNSGDRAATEAQVVHVYQALLDDLGARSGGR